MMSDLIKAQNAPQINWYTCWISLGANGMPDNLIKEGLKQPDRIKISFKKGAKEMLELSKMGTYETYPYLELHGYRALVT
jgi:hypothetical protein